MFKQKQHKDLKKYIEYSTAETLKWLIEQRKRDIKVIRDEIKMIKKEIKLKGQESK